MVGSDIGDINSPTHAGSRSTRGDPKLFGKRPDFFGDRREWPHFEWVFRNWFGFLYDTAEEWLDQAIILRRLGRRCWELLRKNFTSQESTSYNAGSPWSQTEIPQPVENCPS